MKIQNGLRMKILAATVISSFFALATAYGTLADETQPQSAPAIAEDLKKGDEPKLGLNIDGIVYAIFIPTIEGSVYTWNDFYPFLPEEFRSEKDDSPLVSEDDFLKKVEMRAALAERVDSMRAEKQKEFESFVKLLMGDFESKYPDKVYDNYDLDLVFFIVSGQKDKFITEHPKLDPAQINSLYQSYMEYSALLMLHDNIQKNIEVWSKADESRMPETEQPASP
jgi:hypothetical protein